jgi:hypothetical protein
LTNSEGVPTDSRVGCLQLIDIDSQVFSNLRTIITGDNRVGTWQRHRCDSAFDSLCGAVEVRGIAEAGTSIIGRDFD